VPECIVLNGLGFIWSLSDVGVEGKLFTVAGMVVSFLWLALTPGGGASDLTLPGGTVALALLPRKLFAVEGR
jgi:hypothetical protein